MTERCPLCKESVLVYDWKAGAILRLICRNPACRAILDAEYVLIGRWELQKEKTNK